MRILHCCLFGLYKDELFYQENCLSVQNKKDGHDVMIIASTETFVAANKIGFVEPSRYINNFGIKVVRVPYVKIINQWISSKMRAFKGVFDVIRSFNPDVILFHGIGGYEMLTLKRYKKYESNVKIFIDSHEKVFIITE